MFLQAVRPLPLRAVGIDPANLGFQAMKETGYGDVADCMDAIEQLDEMSRIFAAFPAYRSPESGMGLPMASKNFSTVING